jgi:hypothetical protein
VVEEVLWLRGFSRRSPRLWANLKRLNGAFIVGGLKDGDKLVATR